MLLLIAVQSVAVEELVEDALIGGDLGDGFQSGGHVMALDGLID